MATTRHITPVASAPFDPLSSSSVTIIAPTGKGEGYWAGACSILHVESSSKWYLYYRVREPRPVRGGHCYIAESNDGVTFKTIWHATKEQFDSPSIEKGSLVLMPSGLFHLYISYVNPADNRWRIDVLVASSPSEFDPSKRQPVLTAHGGIEGVKDPTVFHVRDLLYMFYSYAHPAKPASAEEMHKTADVYNTGLALSSSGLAVSRDGLKWDVRPPPLVAGEGKHWDAYCSRITSVYRSGGVYLAFYDGSKDVSQNYEEQCGVAAALDLDGKFIRLSPDGPAVISPYKTHSIRYVEVAKVNGSQFVYYEFVREDGAHELRRTTLV